jgi:hypothetical protein
MQKIITEILELVGKSHDTVAKESFRHIDALTYGELLERILLDCGVSPLAEIFPEMSRITTGKLLAEIFPGKPRVQPWFIYILSLVNKKRCPKCAEIKVFTEFSASKTESEGKQSQCKGCRKEDKKAYYQENKDSLQEHGREYSKAYYETHKPDFYARSAKRRATKLSARPSWAKLDVIKRIYQCAEGDHVDHIVPLQGELVCGLHVEYNLQYLSPSENTSKGNKFDPDTYVHTVPS